MKIPPPDLRTLTIALERDFKREGLWKDLIATAEQHDSVQPEVLVREAMENTISAIEPNSNDPFSVSQMFLMVQGNINTLAKDRSEFKLFF